MSVTKRIMHITTSLNVGGLETFLLELLRLTNRECFSPYVCTMTSGGQLVGEFEELGIPISVLSQRAGLDYAMPFRMASLLRRQQIDLVHTHNVSPWLYGLIAAKMARVHHLVHTEHSNVPELQKKLYRVEKFLSYGTDFIIADSTVVNVHLIKAQGIAPERVKTIYNGIDEQKYGGRSKRAKTRSELGIGPEENVIGTVGRLVPIKNHAGLLKAFSKVQREFCNVKLLIVGDGELRASLESQAQILELDHRVLFLGSRRDVPRLLQAMDVFVLSSFSEGLPISLLEAMASGLPIVATDVGGNREVIGDDEAGVLVPADSDEHLAAGIRMFLARPELRREKGCAAQQRVRERFSLRKTVRRYEEIYHNLFSGGTVV